MRIISGKYRGRRLTSPHGARPTTDRAKEGLFSILTSRIDFLGISVLDLYCGSGGLGLEALSRGAGSCVFVDSSRVSVKTTKENIVSCGVEGGQLENSKVVLDSVLQFLSKERGLSGRVDLVFADPPYADAEPKELLEKLESAAILRRDGLVVMEGPLGSRFELPFGSPWKSLVERNYSESLISVYQLAQ